jgi:hypothetical protein
LHFYSDELQLNNPLGSKKDQKICAFYFLVGNIETRYWSSLSNIHLALLCKYSDMKKVGYQKIMPPLLDDVKILEQEGIILHIDGRPFQVFGSIVTFTGDNLTTHATGGFNSSFTSGRIRRQCMVTKMQTRNVHTEDDCMLRTKEVHNYHVRSVEMDPSLLSVYGVKYASPFADLSLYNPVLFFPPNVMHDVLEGMMSVNVSLVIKALVRQNKIRI